MRATVACLLVLAIFVVITEATRFLEELAERSDDKLSDNARCERRDCQGKNSGEKCGRHCVCTWKEVSFARGGSPASSRRRMMCVSKESIKLKRSVYPPLTSVVQPRKA
ncbi:hypothetical protein V5799_010348 [Amblyomma americanum]|uniref:Secreted protein n=1 Tax=Amblyomma americanum TaxID=6943 RepID=A0AAQ4F8A1_AMBAM